MNIYLYYINLGNICLVDASSLTEGAYVNCCCYVIDIYLHIANIPFKNEMLQ